MAGSLWKAAVTAALTTVCFVLYTPPARALQQTLVLVGASGRIVSQEFCSPTEVCQVTTVSGKATHLGNFSGVLEERVDLLTGQYHREWHLHVYWRGHD